MRDNLATQDQRLQDAMRSEFEAVIREFPAQWFQFAPFWPELGMLEDAQAARAAKLGVD